MFYLRVKTSYPRPPGPRALAHALAFATVLSDPRTSTTPSLVPKAALRLFPPPTSPPSSLSRAPSRGTRRGTPSSSSSPRRVVPRDDERLRLRRSFPPRDVHRRQDHYIYFRANHLAEKSDVVLIRRHRHHRRDFRRARKNLRRRAAAHSGVCAPSAQHQPESFPDTITSKTPRGFGAFESASHVFVVDGRGAPPSRSSDAPSRA